MRGCNAGAMEVRAKKAGDNRRADWQPGKACWYNGLSARSFAWNS